MLGGTQVPERLRETAAPPAEATHLNLRNKLVLLAIVLYCVVGPSVTSSLALHPNSVTFELDSQWGSSELDFLVLLFSNATERLW